ncbi:MAG: protein kinase [Vicinamibacterales bacterium]
MVPPQPKTIGRYALIERLGQGGMGVVYRGWDPELQRMVAIKVISGSSESLRDDLFERFVLEARSAASLTHPNIVTVYDFGRHAGRPFIVMELVDGESMAQAIQRGTLPDLAGRVRLAAELCEGLAFAHESGVMHRDVKPANLMITAAGALKILDFGLARLTDALTSAGLTLEGAVVGTPQYMSPEQVSGLGLDARSDIFAVGTVLYELFTGRMAFEGANSALVRLMILHDSPPAMRAVVPGFPARLEAMVVKAMEKDRSRRYQSLGELAAALRAVLRDFDAAAGAAPTRPPSDPSVVGRSADEPALGGMLDQWEQLVGEALATPTPMPQPVPATAGAAPPPALAPEVTRAAAPARPISPAARHAAPPVPRPAAPRESRTRVLVAVALIVLALAVTGAYVAMNRPAGRAPASQVVAPAEPLPGAPATPAPREPAAPPAVDQPASTAPPQEPPPPVDTAGSPPGEAPRPNAQPAARPSDEEPPAGRRAQPLPPDVAGRCAEILHRVGLGDDLSTGDREFLATQCRNRSQ